VGSWIGRAGWGQGKVRGLGRTIRWGAGLGARAGDKIGCAAGSNHQVRDWVGRAGWVGLSGGGLGRARAGLSSGGCRQSPRTSSRLVAVKFLRVNVVVIYYIY
jgi:hypothetical protein